MNRDQAVQVHARTVAGFCAAYGIGKTKVYELLATGVLRAVKMGTRTLIVEASAQEWLSSLPVRVPGTETRPDANKSEHPRK